MRKRSFRQKMLLKMVNFWPPFLAAGIKVKNVGQDMRSVDVEMKMWPWNRNYVGTHFGGSIYAMTDPFYMLMLMENMGNDYILWDKAADIKFKKPGKGKLTAHFNLTQERIAEIRAEADNNPKAEPKFLVEVKDESGDVVAEVLKTVYVRRKDRGEKPPSLSGK